MLMNRHRFLEEEDEQLDGDNDEPEEKDRFGRMRRKV